MNFAQAMGLLRLIMSAGGAAFIGHALNIDPNAVNGALSASTPGDVIVGLVPIIAAGAWSLYAHTVGATVDRAVGLTGGVTSPLRPAAPAAVAQAKGLKTRLSPNG